MKWVTSCCAALSAVCAFAEPLLLPPLPDSPYADTEVATNIPFVTGRSDVREFGVEMFFTGTASNCVQIAFGRDADGDGDLAPEEMSLLLGWRAGSYFIEDVPGRLRMAEQADAVPGDARGLSLHVGLDRSLRPRTVAATNETGACFLSLSEAVPSFLYGTDWNMVKVTGRGVEAVDEAIAVECLYRFFRISIR